MGRSIVSVHYQYTQANAYYIMAFNGNWRIATKGDTFGDYLEKIGVGLIKRTLAKKGSRDFIFSNFSATGYNLKSVIAVSTTEKTVVFGKKYEGKRDDGQDAEGHYELEGDKIVQYETLKKTGVKYTVTWSVVGEELHMLLECDGAKCTNVFKKF